MDELADKTCYQQENATFNRKPGPGFLVEHSADTLGASEVRHEPQQRPGYRPG
jgi:hypothetical protein